MAELRAKGFEAGGNSADDKGEGSGIMEGIGLRQRLVWLLSASVIALGIGLFVPKDDEGN